jgi:hypothetical protein
MHRLSQLKGFEFRNRLNIPSVGLEKLSHFYSPIRRFFKAVFTNVVS